MKVINRLYLTMAPAVVAMLLLAALAYWGRYARQAPENITLIGAVVVLASLALSWANARSVGSRLARLAARPAGARDEIAEIEHVVDSLSGAVATAATDKALQAELFERRASEYARLLVAVADASARELEEVRLPLHILLENRFGELNENQEEMLGAARTAAETLDADIVSVRQIAELDLGEHPLRNDRLKAIDLIDAIRPMLIASAESAGVTIELDIAPLLPAIRGDRARLQDALVTLIRAVILAAASESRIRVGVGQESRSIVATISGGGAPRRSIRWAVGVRVVQAHGGVVEERDDALVIRLPIGES
jgi:signal transduction histidine kinase